MRVLLVGSGGREHALAEAIAASPLLGTLWTAPGNPGTAAHGTNVAIDPTDVSALVSYAIEHRVDLVVPGGEATLEAGLGDACDEAGIACCGPTREAARLETSKAFAKALCDEAGIPTARWERFEDATAAHDFVRRRGAPVVVKADGLAAGKGVIVAGSVAEAEAAVDALLPLSGALLVEEFLEGEEISVFALCDGRDAICLGAAQDHKRLGEGDTGPNTGGMGAISPPPGFDRAAEAEALDRFVRPVLAALAARGTPFRGILYAGLMLTASGPYLIEYNVRFGDPECQALLPRLQSDLLPALAAACDGELGAFELRFRAVAACAVTLAAPGYPSRPRKGEPIGLAGASGRADAHVFHAGTREDHGRLLSDGGRVLTICATGPDLGAARDAAYAAVGAVDWPGAVYRRDIGARALAGIRGLP